MIIAISGPSSTGKTTLLQDLYHRNNVLTLATDASEVILVKETARSLFEDYFSDRYVTFEELLGNDRDTIEFEILVAKDQIASYNEYNENSSVLYLCDRCPLDTMVYLALNYQYASKEVREEYSNRYLSIMRELFDCYNNSDIRVYRTFPFPDESIEADGFRPIQYIYRRQAELMAFDLVNVDLVELPDNRHDRVETIMNDLLLRSFHNHIEENTSKIMLPKHKYKLSARDLIPYKEGQDEIPPKVMYADSDLGYHIKLFFLKLFYDYIDVEYNPNWTVR